MPSILYLSRGGQIGGSQRQLYYLLAGLDRQRYKPVVICREEGPFLDFLRGEGIEVHLVPLHSWRKWPGALRRFADVRRLVRFARQRRVGLIHGSDLWLSGYARSVARSLKVPVVLHVRTPMPPAEVRKHRCRRAEAIVAISNRVRANLMAGGVLEEKITMIYDAVDLERFHPRLRQDNALRRQFPHAKGTLLGIVGRIDRFKRQLDFLHAAARVAGTGAENATFFVIGAPHDLLYHQQVRGFVSANGLAERVIFTGRREDMPEVLASLDALVSLSGGSVMIEAMACGTPVISAAFTPAGQSTIVHDGLTGLHVSSNNGADLEAAIKRIIDYPHLGEWMGRHARRHAETRFSHTTLVAATQGLYDRLL